MLSFLKEIKARFLAKTPAFFKKIQKTCLAVGATGGFILGGAQVNFKFPEYLITYAGYMVTVGVFGYFLTQLTRDQAPDFGAANGLPQQPTTPPATGNTQAPVNPAKPDELIMKDPTAK